MGLERIDRKKFVSRLKDYFSELNKKIQTVHGSNDGRIPQSVACFVIFKSQLDDAKTLISAHQTYLKAKELSEIQEIVNQELRLIGMLPQTQFLKRKCMSNFLIVWLN